ncbi:putative holin-like toxin [Bacillus coahuilensis]
MTVYEALSLMIIFATLVISLQGNSKDK